MKNALANAQAGYDTNSRPFRLSRLAAALAASSLFAVGSVHAGVITDSGNEPGNDTLAGATMGVLGDEFQGCVGINCFSSSNPSVDDVDFVGFNGLVAGATYTLTVTALDGWAAFNYFGGGTTVLQTLGGGGIFAPVTLSGLTGLTSLKVGAFDSDEFGVEGYRIQLTKTADASVPEPASAALLAAGLVATFVARRRKRS